MSLDKFQAYTLPREIPGSLFHLDENKNYYVGEVPINQDTFEDINNFYVRQRINIDTCDILVSVNSNQKQGIVSAPTIVNRMLKYLDCKVSFSYTVS
ncbi:hypothetical protein RS130_20320 [Paraglaciecola aquimarina]|uniref:Uncharacterized protein n=1 Tax=Paraglaciecola aquimarina TaxID=1235557 RepID=A0ABU3T0Y7_9ALTE|nr:hypothetical protein [Paraglaciecola aquimarina]MDU0355918.1 hypothetical protein [Paraglaciecola aquimarina]